ncbi:MAG: sn-glycerol-3-phosphate ABC transporter ATP-binding protein UgpC [Oscillospiraceae bacterium]|nr:sn-glycerol-3-phosphate ABC transporter ATP-binding protein UgpC [Oscillospiraceae bacterium]
MASISFKNVKKTYDNGVQVVKGFDLEVADKEFIVLVGASGCGKSTTLRMIAGLEDITEGELWIGDRLVNNVPPKERDIAMVFQSYALYPHMTVYDNMAFALKLAGESKEVIDEKVKEAAEILGLTDYLDRKPKALSGGQRQRVALGRAMVRKPAVFLLDEPLSNLDAKLRTEMRSQLAHLHKKLGTTFVYVTHDQTEAMTLGTRIVVMNAGVIQQVDTPRNLYTKPVNKFVAGFIGSPTMNFSDAVVVEKEGGVWLDFAGYSVKLNEEKAAVLKEKGYIGKEVIFGIRPEDVYEYSDYPEKEKAENASLTAEVDMYELLGSDVILYFYVGENKFTAIVNPATEARTGDTVKFAFDVNNMHIFDKETEYIICH